MFFGRKFRGYHGGKLSGLDILVLSLIKNKSEISGYDIIQKLNNKFRGIWTASAGTIYPLLNRLEEKGFIKSSEVMDSKRNKKTYDVTIKGIEQLKQVLEDNLEPSINSIGDFIKTIFKAIPSEDMMDKMMCRFPFPEFPFEETIDENDFSLRNIKRLERILRHLNHERHHIKNRMKILDEKIDKYSRILEKLKESRSSKAKTIEIVDDDEEFENF